MNEQISLARKPGENSIHQIVLSGIDATLGVIQATVSSPAQDWLDPQGDPGRGGDTDWLTALFSSLFSFFLNGVLT